MSMEVIFALIKTGTRGETAQQIATAVHLPRTQERTLQTFTFIKPALKSTNKYTLNSSNKIFVKDGFEISDQYKEIAVNVFGADLQKFSHENYRKMANQWAEEKVNNKIKNVIEANNLDEDTRLVFINFFHYEGKWVTRLNNNLSKSMPFFLNSVNSVNMDMIEATQNCFYFEDNKIKAKFLQLPCEGDDVIITIVLPDSKEGLPAIEQMVEYVLTRPILSKQEVHVRIPKFEIKSSIKFNDVLKSLGMNLPFNEGADFSKITGKNQNSSLTISEVIQKTFVEIETKNATKTETKNGVSLDELKSNEIIEPKTFHADHPFMLHLRHAVIGVFFIGRYTGISRQPAKLT